MFLNSPCDNSSVVVDITEIPYNLFKFSIALFKKLALFTDEVSVSTVSPSL